MSAPVPPPAVVTAWQAALAAEHRAVFGYQLLGPRLPAAHQHLARRGEAAHDTLRDDTSATMRAHGVSPVAPAVDYPDLYPVGDGGAAERLGLRLEDDCAQAWRLLYLRAASAGSSTTGGSAGAARSLRASAQGALTASAVRAVQWRALLHPARASVPFPGL